LAQHIAQQTAVYSPVRAATLHNFISSRSTGQLIIAAIMVNPSRAAMHTLTISTVPLHQILIRFAIQFFRLAAHAFHERFATGSLFIGTLMPLMLIEFRQLEKQAATMRYEWNTNTAIIFTPF
jgi:hypothetical protein